MQFFVRGCELQAHDRGLKELLASSAHGGHCVALSRPSELADRLEAYLDPRAPG